MRWSGVVVVAAVVVMQVVEGARILLLAPMDSKSHKIFFMSIAEALTARNHTVTYLTGTQVLKPRANIHEVFVPDVNAFEKLSHHNMFVPGFSGLMDTMYSIPKSCADALSSNEMQRVQKEAFDLVLLSIIGTECFYPYIYKLQVPYIFMTPNALTGSSSDQAGNPHFPSMVPNNILDLKYPLTFTGRMINTLSDVVGTAMALYDIYPRIEAECLSRHLWPDDAPSLAEMRLNGSLFIVNSVKTIEKPPIPYVPTVIHAGGIHCRPARPLPHELEEWVAGAGDPGFVFFSLGSLVKSSFVKDEHYTLLLQVFASLEQRVLWKWDQVTMENLPANVLVRKWFPQQDILGDPRLRLFITHGGLLSTHEATYHGVPLLGLPVFLDQHSNMLKVQQDGWGRYLKWDNLTYDNLRQNIIDLIHDTSVRGEAARRSTLMRDQPLPTDEWLTYWVEYVLRYRGATHLRCPARTMPWYVLYNVDVWLLVAVVLALALYLTFRLVLALFTCLCSARKRKQD